MTLEDLGYHEELGRYQQMQHLHSFEIGRIAAEHRERYTVLTEKGELEAEVIGQLRFSASDRSDFPAVGDWVAVSVFNESDAIIHAIYPRRSILERQAVGKFGEKQIIAANIDYALIIQAVDRDFNLNRLERYLAISYAGNIEPVIILSKIDLVNKDELAYLVNKIAGRIRNIHIIARKDLLRTNSLSKSTKKGRHVTSHREMVVLEKGGILVDNPGMREIGLADTAGGLETTFDLITELSTECKYSDCKHIQEDGCAILASVDNGDLDRAAYENYLKMVREKIHFQSSIAEKRRKDKEIGRMIKAFMKHRKQNE